MTAPPNTEEPTVRERFVGCLLAGAVGDALGAPVEFLSWAQIQQRVGSSGIRSYLPAYEGSGCITDDTQMTLFTAEGLIRAQHRLLDRGLANVTSVLHRAYLRWLLTQVRDPRGVPWDPEIGEDTSGWLLEQSFLHSRRAPGNTCMGALLSGAIGTPEKPLNDSKGCGGVMRVAPVGLVADDPFDLGCRIAAITHGHPSGWVAGGALSQIIARVVGGRSIRRSVEEALDTCRSVRSGEGVAKALTHALALADEDRSPTPARVELLGGGWVAEEALAISVFCALVARDPMDALALAVNHSGDSDSTGAITGNVLGAALGVDWLDVGLLEQLEGRNVIEQVAIDLHNVIAQDLSNGVDWFRYPPW